MKYATVFNATACAILAITLFGMVMPNDASAATYRRSLGDEQAGKLQLKITCPPDITIDCSQTPDPTLTGFPTIEGGMPPYDTLYVDERCPGSGQVICVIARTWMVTDVQGSVAMCSQAISVVDTTPPVITCPPDLEFSCDNVGDFGEPQVEDNCDRRPDVTYEDSTIYFHDPEICPYEYVLLRKWTATDDAGNSSSCIQRIVIEDSEAPRITFCPPNQTVACIDEVASLPNATAVDNCNPELDQIPFEYSYEVIRKPGGTPCEYKIVRLWQFHDGCCNISSCQQVVTVKDTIPPVLRCAPDDTIECQAQPVFTDPSISDNCTDAPELSVVLNDTLMDPTGGGQIFRRCWIGTDNCGNESDTGCQHIYRPFCGGFCSFTIGGWGSRCPAPQVEDPYSTQPGCIRDHYFDEVFPQGVTIGVVGDPDAHFAKWTSAEAVEDFLPDGGKPGELGSDLINPTTTPAGVLASQVLGLRLNREFSCSGVFQTIGMSPTTSCYGEFVIPDDCGKFAGLTVDEFLAIADFAVGGKLEVLEPYGASLSDVNETATCLNELYHECHLNDVSHDDNGSEPSLPENDVLANTSSDELSLDANPNPVAGKTVITFNLPTSGRALVEIYDIQGRKIRTLSSARLESGIHSVIWYGNDDTGKKVSPGVYFCRLHFETGHGTLEKLIKL